MASDFHSGHHMVSMRGESLDEEWTWGVRGPEAEKYPNGRWDQGID